MSALTRISSSYELEGMDVLIGNQAWELIFGNVQLRFLSGRTLLLTNVMHVTSVQKNLVYGN